MLARRYPADTHLLVLRTACGASRSAARPLNGPLVAVQCVEDPLYIALFSALYEELREQFGARGELVVVRSISGAIGLGWWPGVRRLTLVSLMLSSQWVRSFRGLIDHVAYRSQSLVHPIGDLLDWVRSLRIWRRKRAADGAFELEVGGVPVGDLITDSYLRFRPSPRFVAGDRFTLRLIWQAHRDVRRARAYFRKRKPRLYLTSYSTYLEHGIAVRVALQEGVRVHSFSNFTNFGKKLTLSDWFHTPNTDNYKDEFDAMDQQAARLAQAEAQLQVRLSGGIDAATSYMRVSAYADAADEPPPGVKGAVVVFLHDFYDSPHIYPDLVFRDFWSWIGFTIETLLGSGIRFYVKPHPNQIALSGEALQKLNAAYPGLLLLSPRITNMQLVNAGMLCGVTVYGTVAHELAYLGIPTIACARHPHNAFGFCRTARTVTEYAEYLRTPAHMPLSKQDMRRQALAFYYMYNQHGEAGDLALRAGFSAFWNACHSPETPNSELLKRFHELRNLPAFKAFAARLL